MAKLEISQKSSRIAGRAAVAAAIILVAVSTLHAETCTTQSQMKPADRESIAAAARILSSNVQADDANAFRQHTTPELAKDFTVMTSLIANTSAKIAGARLVVDQVYLLDATNLKPRADSTNPDAQFFCSLNNSIAEATFQFAALPPAQYAFAHVVAQVSTQPSQLSYLLHRDSNAAWTVAGFYPKPLTAAGHDGLWYWTQARDQAKSKRLWTGYLFYKQAEALLQPAGFIGSTHLEKLRKESSESTPPALSSGIDADTPLVVRSSSGMEFRFTTFTTDDSLPGDRLYVVVHLAADPVADLAPTPAPAATAGNAKSTPTSAPTSAKERSSAAMAALLAAYPELRTSFGGVWVFAETPGKAPFVTEQAMADIH